MWDAIIVGAGPAGSAAAMQLARSGASVMIVEKAAMPRPKACGDGLTPRAVDALESLRVDLPELLPVGGLRLCADSREGSFERRYSTRPAGMVARLVLDDRLAQTAVSSGAELRTRVSAESLIVEDGVVCGVRLRTPQGGSEDVRAPITVLACGASSRIGRSLSRSRKPGTGFAVRSYFEGVKWDGPPTFDVVMPLDSVHASVAGYGWIFPLQGDRANVGVGFFQPSKGRKTPLHDLLNAFEQRLRRHDARFAHARRLGRPIGAALASGGSPADAFGPGFLVVGDAAGLANPYSGEGISQALESGAMAAEAVASLLAGGNSSHFGELLAAAGLARRGVGAGLPTAYRCISRSSRDFVSMMRADTEATRCLWAEFDATVRTPSPPVAADGGEIAAVARQAALRARRLALRERPLLNEIVGRVVVEEQSDRCLAAIFLRACASYSGFVPSGRDILRAATCLELLGIATALLDDTDLDLAASHDSSLRGGGWAAATFALCLGDSVLARAFSHASRLSDPARRLISDAILEVMSTLTSDAGDAVSPSAIRRRDVLAAAAARAGSRMGEATPAGSREVGCRLHS